MSTTLNDAQHLEIALLMLADPKYFVGVANGDDGGTAKWWLSLRLVDNSKTFGDEDQSSRIFSTRDEIFTHYANQVVKRRMKGEEW